MEMKEGKTMITRTSVFRSASSVVAVLLGIAAYAVQAQDLSDTEMKKAQSYLESNLIAPCCYRQPIADHESQAADDMKKEISAMLASGKTVAQIEDYYIDKYGERILAVPRMEGFNMISFLMPVFIFAFGFLIIMLTIRRMVMKKPAGSRAANAQAAEVQESMNDRIESELKKL